MRFSMVQSRLVNKFTGIHTETFSAIRHNYPKYLYTQFKKCLGCEFHCRQYSLNASSDKRQKWKLSSVQADLCNLNGYWRFPKRYSRYLEGQVTSNVKEEPPWKILFFGTDEYAVQHLIALNENRIAGDSKAVKDLEVVVPKANCIVKSYAEEHGIQIHEWPIPTMNNNYDVGVIVSFGHLIPKRIIRMFPFGILNVHPSLLPRWRGASPIIHSILNGDTETGISIMEIKPEHFDIGPLLLQRKYNLPESYTTFQLRDFLASQGKYLLLQTLHDLPRMERLEREQCDAGVTYAHKLSLVNSKMNWNLQTPEHIDRQYRALSEMFPLRSEWKGQTIRLLDMVSLDEMKDKKVQYLIHSTYPDDKVCPRPGLPFYHKPANILCIRCRNGWVGFRSVVIKKAMTAKAFYNGYLSKNDNKGICFTSSENELDKYTFRTSASQVKVKQNGRRKLVGV